MSPVCLNCLSDCLDCLSGCHYIECIMHLKRLADYPDCLSRQLDSQCGGFDGLYKCPDYLSSCLNFHPLTIICRSYTVCLGVLTFCVKVSKLSVCLAGQLRECLNGLSHSVDYLSVFFTICLVVQIFCEGGSIVRLIVLTIMSDV